MGAFRRCGAKSRVFQSGYPRFVAPTDGECVGQNGKDVVDGFANRHRFLFVHAGLLPPDGDVDVREADESCDEEQGKDDRHGEPEDAPAHEAVVRVVWIACWFVHSTPVSDL